MVKLERILLFVFFLEVYQVSGLVFAIELSLAGYQRSDGAITVHYNGDRVDPYFASKALLAALDAGLDVRRASMAWIEWALPHQLSDGRFQRFCVKDDRYVACAPADADDAILAVWIELLAKLAPADGPSPAWESSLRNAYSYLTTLYDEKIGVYHISATEQVGLQMDNVEVYSALKAMSQLEPVHLGNGDEVRAIVNQAERLLGNIQRVFWQTQLQSYRVSTEAPVASNFYPDQIAQLFPMLVGMPTPHRDEAAFFDSWIATNYKTWREQASFDYPWGLVALAANKMGFRHTVASWICLARPLRHGAHWNVLEEAVYQALSTQITTDTENTWPCNKGSAK